MSQYIDRSEAQKSYRPVAGSMSPGLKRAREPYRLKNAILGLALGAFAVGVWAYSISAVKQDIFDDVDEEAKALSAPPAAAATAAAASTGQDGTVAAPTAAAEQQKQLEQSSTSAAVSTSIVAEAQKAIKTAPRGVLQHLNYHLPWLLDPNGKTLVWGAPPVDNVGKMRRS